MWIAKVLGFVYGLVYGGLALIWLATYAGLGVLLAFGEYGNTGGLAALASLVALAVGVLYAAGKLLWPRPRLRAFVISISLGAVLGAFLAPLAGGLLFYWLLVAPAPTLVPQVSLTGRPLPSPAPTIFLYQAWGYLALSGFVWLPLLGLLALRRATRRAGGGAARRRPLPTRPSCPPPGSSPASRWSRWPEHRSCPRHRRRRLAGSPACTWVSCPSAKSRR